MSNVPRPVISLKRSSAPPKPAAPVEPVPAPQLERFYFVWRTDSRAPRKRHATAELALAEAQRLRTLSPDAQYVVYTATRIEESNP